MKRCGALCIWDNPIACWLHDVSDPSSSELELSCCLGKGALPCAMVEVERVGVLVGDEAQVVEGTELEGIGLDRVSLKA